MVGQIPDYSQLLPSSYNTNSNGGLGQFSQAQSLQGLQNLLSPQQQNLNMFMQSAGGNGQNNPIANLVQQQQQQRGQNYQTQNPQNGQYQNPQQIPPQTSPAYSSIPQLTAAFGNNNMIGGQAIANQNPQQNGLSIGGMQVSTPQYSQGTYSPVQTPMGGFQKDDLAGKNYFTQDSSGSYVPYSQQSGQTSGPYAQSNQQLYQYNAPAYTGQTPINFGGLATNNLVQK